VLVVSILYYLFLALFFSFAFGAVLVVLVLNKNQSLPVLVVFHLIIENLYKLS